MKTAAPSSEGSRSLIRSRAAALPPDERRAAIVAATVPLLLEHGEAISTRQIAEAADIAEGTIFRSSPTSRLSCGPRSRPRSIPAPSRRRSRPSTATSPFEAQLIEAAELLQTRFASIWRLMPVARDIGVIRRASPSGPTCTPSPTSFAPFADQLRLDPEHRGPPAALARPRHQPSRLQANGPPPAEELVALVLDGIRIHPTRKSR